jgi:serine O-acetyltransferase
VKRILIKFRAAVLKILGIPNPSLPVYRSDFPDGKLEGKPAQIGRFSIIDYGGGVKFGENVKIGYGAYILSVATITGSQKKPIIREPIVIGDNVEIGAQAIILPGVTVGNNATIGAGAVVDKDIPENSIAVGVPAKVVKRRSAD